MGQLTYRGYYWDKDLGLYYCNSRYYDQQTGRWISPDTLVSLNPSVIGGLNLYAYRYNNPINSFNNSISNGGDNSTIISAPKTTLSAKHNIFSEVKLGKWTHLSITTFSQELWDINLFGVLNVHHSITTSHADYDKPFLYSYFEQSNFISEWGVGYNFGGWYGAEFGVSYGWSGLDFLWTGKDSPFDFTTTGQLTPWFKISSSVGLGGISITLSFGKGEVTKDYTFTLTPFGILALVLAGIEVPIITPIRAPAY